ncbi:helix-turn-helix transcriptional regulator [Actinoplanes sp. NPDC024001]|uniref:helix-turn-helix domain-containing protein n=1 Tax=Actinoplanes sp. NPDC024001 TaxID=3154598 RepID=UPI0033F7DCBD
MAAEVGPIGSGRLLRAALRRARESALLTQNEAARLLSWSPSKLARIENGEVGISASDLHALCEVLSLGPAATGELLRLAQAARRRGWWHEYRALMSPHHFQLVGLEAEADEIDEYCSTVISGLYQTQAYVEAILRSIRHTDEPDSNATRVAIRLRHQREIEKRPDPPEMRLLLDEAVLYRQVGDGAVMAGQLRRLVEVARRPLATIRVLPFESREFREYPFTVVRDHVAGTAVYSDWTMGDSLIEDERRVGWYEQHFANLWAAALDPDRTGQLLHRAVAAYAKGETPRPWLWD